MRASQADRLEVRDIDVALAQLPRNNVKYCFSSPRRIFLCRNRPITGCSIENAMSRLACGREKLRALLDEGTGQARLRVVKMNASLPPTKTNSMLTSMASWNGPPCRYRRRVWRLSRCRRASPTGRSRNAPVRGLWVDPGGSSAAPSRSCRQLAPEPHPLGLRLCRCGRLAGTGAVIGYGVKVTSPALEAGLSPHRLQCGYRPRRPIPRRSAIPSKSLRIRRPTWFNGCPTAWDAPESSAAFSDGFALSVAACFLEKAVRLPSSCTRMVGKRLYPLMYAPMLPKIAR